MGAQRGGGHPRNRGRRREERGVVGNLGHRRGRGRRPGLLGSAVGQPDGQVHSEVTGGRVDESVEAPKEGEVVETTVVVKEPEESPSETKAPSPSSKKKVSESGWAGGDINKGDMIPFNGIYVQFADKDLLRLHLQATTAAAESDTDDGEDDGDD